MVLLWNDDLDKCGGDENVQHPRLFYGKWIDDLMLLRTHKKTASPLRSDGFGCGNDLYRLM